MNSSANAQLASRAKTNQNIQVYVRVRPLNSREKCIRSHEVVEVSSPKEIVARQMPDSKMTKKFTFDKTFGPNSKQVEVYQTVVAPLIEEVLSGYNCTVFAYGQTGTGKTHTMVGEECPELKSSWEDESTVGIIPRALSHLFDELRMMGVEFSMRISYLELYNEELCDLLSTDDGTKIRIYDDANKKGSVIIQGLEEVPVHSKEDVYKLLEKGKERRKTATTLMNAQSSRSHTVFSILVHIKENGMDGEEMLKIGKLNLVDLAGSENISKAGNEKGIRTRETVNINQSLLTLGRVITALVERAPHVPYRESKLTRLLQESLGGRTKTSIIATISPGHKDLEETLSTLEYAHRAKNIQNKPELNQKLTKKIVLKEYLEEIDRLKRDLMACRDKNGIYLAEDTYNDLQYKLDSQNRELNEKILLLKAIKDDLASKERFFNEVSLNLVEKTEELNEKEKNLVETKSELIETKTALDQTKRVLTTTKKRYKEKKYLLETHLKTEQELTQQAKKLVEVVNVATTDTVRLHETIDRRRMYEQQIKAACDKFVDKMQSSFNNMDATFADYQNHREVYSREIRDGIAHCTQEYKSFSSAITNKLSSISTMSQQFLTLVEMFEFMLSTFGNEKSSGLEAFKKMLEKIKQQHSQVEKNYDEKIVETVNLIEKYRSTTEEISTKLIEYINANEALAVDFHTVNTNDIRSNMERHEKELKSELENIIATLHEQEKISNERENEINEMEKTFANFISKLRSYDDQNKTAILKLKNLSSEVRNTNDETVKRFGTTLENMDHYKQSVKENQNDFRNSVSASVLESNSICDEHIQKNTELQRFLADHLREETNALDKLQGVDTENLNKLDMLVHRTKEEMKHSQGSLTEQIVSACEEGKETVNTERDRFIGHCTQTSALNLSLDSHFTECKGSYKRIASECLDNLKEFHQKEFRTYTPTGTTPAKKEYHYPRILAATSPHNHLLHRFRLENEWSDLDTSATLTEDSELTLHDLSDAKVVINSTPIKSSNDESNKDTPLTCDFNFKQPKIVSLSGEENISMISLQKSSPGLLSVKEEDKENVF